MISKKPIVLLPHLILYLCFLTFFAPLVLAENLLSIGSGYGLPGSVSSGVHVTLENDVPVSGVQFTFYDKNGYLTIEEIRTTERTEGFFANANEKNGIVILISLSGKNIAPGEGSILEISFYVSEEAPEGECRNLYLENVKIVQKTSSLDLSSPNVFTEHSIKESKNLSESAQFCFTESMPTTTTTMIPTTSTTIFVCPTLYIYDEHSEEAEILRYIRDNVLSETPEGQEIIRLYYQWSPVIVKAMEEDEGFKEDVKEMMDGVLLLIEEEVE